MRRFLLLVYAGGVPSAPPGPASIAAASPAQAVPAPAGGAKGCLPGGNGYLRARIRGALNLDIDWHDAEIECDGGPRPDGSGLRVSFAGPRHADGRRLRLVFGVGSVQEGRTGRALPTNLTVIFEGEERVFATRGEDHCTVDELRQERLGAPRGARRPSRLVPPRLSTPPGPTRPPGARLLVSPRPFARRAPFAGQRKHVPPEPP